LRPLFFSKALGAEVVAWDNWIEGYATGNRHLAKPNGELWWQGKEWMPSIYGAQQEGKAQRGRWGYWQYKFRPTPTSLQSGGSAYP